MNVRGILNETAIQIAQTGFKAPSLKVDKMGKIHFVKIVSLDFAGRIRKLTEIYPGMEDVKCVEQASIQSLKKLEKLKNGKMAVLFTIFQQQDGGMEAIPTIYALYDKSTWGEERTEKQTIEVLKELDVEGNFQKEFVEIEMLSLFEPLKAEQKLRKMEQRMFDRLEWGFEVLEEKLMAQITEIITQAENRLKEEVAK